MDFLIVLLNKKNLTEGVKTHGTSRNFPNIQGKSFEKSTHKSSTFPILPFHLQINVTL